MNGPAGPGAAEDLYAVLGVEQGASQAAIRQAYRRLARGCHPDVSATAEASDRFRRLAAAYEVLGDAATRRTYDRRRASVPRSGVRPQGPSATHRAPGPSWNPAVRGPAAQPARASSRGRRQAPARPERTSSDEWRLATTVGKVLAVIALLMVLAFGTMVLVTVTSEPASVPVPTIYCKTPGGWLDCRQAMDPR